MPTEADTTNASRIEVSVTMVVQALAVERRSLEDRRQSGQNLVECGIRDSLDSFAPARTQVECAGLITSDHACGFCLGQGHREASSPGETSATGYRDNHRNQSYPVESIR
jgi:hypothetical protein